MPAFVAVPMKLYDPSFTGSEMTLVKVKVVDQYDGVTVFKNSHGILEKAISTEVYTVQAENE